MRVYIHINANQYAFLKEASGSYRNCLDKNAILCAFQRSVDAGMRFLKLWQVLLSVLVLSVFVAHAEQTFEFDRIEVKGAARIDQKTIRHYLPVTTGKSVKASVLSDAVRSMYQTGFFQKVDLYQDGRTLIVSVEENPFVYQIHFQGNNALTSSDLSRVAEQMGLKEGEPFHPDIAHTFKRALMQEYQRKGFYNVAVQINQQAKSQHRVVLDIVVTEGKEAMVQNVTFAGNKAFSTGKLKGLVSMRPQLWSFLSHNNRYSEERLNQDMEAMRSLYLNHGHLNINIVKPKVVVDRATSNINLNFKIQEGPVFTLGHVDLHYKGVHKEALQNVADSLQMGQVFSRSRIQKALKSMQKILVDAGYTNAQIKVDPRKWKDKNVVDIAFDVFPGKPVFVRQISFKGNQRTHEKVLRREMRQFENTLLNQFQLQESERRLNNLGYLRGSHCEPFPVGGREDLVDLNCSVEEISSATASASLGFSTQGGMLFGLSLSQSNFLGTGNSVSLRAERSQIAEVLQFSYTNPYFWSSEVSQQISMGFRHSTPGNQNVTKYKTDGYHLGLDYRWPIAAYDYVTLGGKWSRVHVMDYQNSAQRIQDYITANGDNYWLYTLHAGWNHSRLDRAIFPTKGSRQTVDANVSLPLADQSLGYYTLEYRGSQYWPIGTAGYVAHVRGNVAYGQGYGSAGKDLPFFRYFYAGGINSVRGYRSNSLGEQDENNNSIGGNARLTATAEVFVPQWFGDQYRFGAFLDAGNVFDGGFVFGSDEGLRFSAGISAHIRTALVPMEIALSVPLNATDSDEKEAFSFSLGMGF